MTRPTMNLISETYCYVRGRNVALVKLIVKLHFVFLFLFFWDLDLDFEGWGG